MRVLMFGWELPPHNSGGLGVACYGIAEALAQQGVNVTFVLPRAGQYARGHFSVCYANNANIDVEYVDSPLRPYLTAEQYEKLSDQEKSQYGRTLYDEVARFGRAAKKIAQKEHFDIIHAHDWLSYDAGVAAREATGKPLIVHAHLTGYEQSCGRGIDPRVMAVEQKGYNKSDHIIAVSNLTKNIIVENYNIKPEKISVVYNGVTIAPHTDALPNKIRLSLGANKLVLFVGRLTMHKGPDYFIRAAQLVLKKRKDVLFAIAGSGEMEYQMVRLAAELGIGEHVLFAGFVRGGALEQLYRGADLYVMSSIHDPFGITALEALSYNTPALISKQAGASEALANILRVDFWDVREMASKILAVLSYEPLAQTLSAEGYKEVRHFPWSRAASEIAAIYNNVLTRELAYARV